MLTIRLYVDHIAVPGRYGAMENWGCICYMENMFLWKDDWMDSNAEWKAAGIIAHELTHQVETSQEDNNILKIQIINFSGLETL